jgi:hypothetical protein
MSKKLLYLLSLGLIAGFLNFLWLNTFIMTLFLFGDVGGSWLDLLIASIPLLLAVIATTLLVRALDVSWWRGGIASLAAQLGVPLLVSSYTLWPFTLVLLCMMSLLLATIGRTWRVTLRTMRWFGAAILCILLVLLPLSYGYNPNILIGLAAWIVLPALLWQTLPHQQH